MFNASDAAVTGECNISETCLSMDCDLLIQLEGFTLPLALSVNLLPCQCTFAISVKAEVTYFGSKFSIVDGTFSSNTTIPFQIFFITGTVDIVILQHNRGMLISVSSHLYIGFFITRVDMYRNY